MDDPDTAALLRDVHRRLEFIAFLLAVLVATRGPSHSSSAALRWDRSR